MEKEGWITQLGRLYKEVSTSDPGQAGDAYSEQFNRILSNLQDAYPDNDFIQNTEEVSTGRGDVFAQDNAVKEVRLKCGQLADELGFDLPKSELEQVNDMTVIAVQNEQTAEQNVTQEISIENVMEMINYTTLNQTQQDDLRDIVREFEDELSKENPDASKLREFIKSAKGYSVDVSAKLAMLALSNGLVDVLGF